MTHTSEYGGYKIVVTSIEDLVLKTWTASALIHFSEHNKVEVGKPNFGAGEAGHALEEDATKSALHAAHNRIDHSNAKRGISK